MKPFVRSSPIIVGKHVHVAHLYSGMDETSASKFGGSSLKPPTLQICGVINRGDGGENMAPF